MKINIYLILILLIICKINNIYLKIKKYYFLA